MFRLAVFLSLIGAAVHAGGREALFGTWGTARQCAGAMLKPEGTMKAEPFDIRPGWIRHGQMWCALRWFPVQPRPGGLFASARALCGEDSARSFRLDMALSGQELHLIWNESVVNGPLRRCTDSSEAG